MSKRNRKNAIHETPKWRYSCYDEGKTPNLWHQWYEDHPDAQGSHDATFEALEGMVAWTKPYALALGDGLIEVRLSGHKIEYRIFGFYGSGRWHFVAVATGSHKGNVYSPKDIIATAKRIKTEIETGKSKVQICGRPKQT